ncbi:MAG: CDP-diacylglycerol--glycerol-3-phosphate 3-phosphatidyltransferase [Ruminococcaceae bacterium]|nr:CDP-diacylglycerol--glycerol-3-phosphate 3-phosphatidyltransferase [Oscillospiraceae bacterium]
MTVPNILTLLRIALIPVFWVLAVSPSPLLRFLALIVFIAASLTDLIDGKIARKTGQITTFGKIMDPLADKLLVISALLIFVAQSRMTAVAAMIIIARELAITSLRVVAAGEGIVMAAAKSGKWKTTAQMSYIILMLLHITELPFLPLPGIIETIAQWAVTLVTIWSGVDYFYANRHMIKASVK